LFTSICIFPLYLLLQSLVSLAYRVLQRLWFPLANNVPHELIVETGMNPLLEGIYSVFRLIVLILSAHSSIVFLFVLQSFFLKG
jgi:hypothetical protein